MTITATMPTRYRPSEVRGGANITCGAWDDEITNDSAYGLNTPAVNSPRPTLRRGASDLTGLTLTPRDATLLTFLGRYRYATLDQLTHLVAGNRDSMATRLRRLERAGFVYLHPITQGVYVYSATATGQQVVGIEGEVMSRGGVAWQAFAHTQALAEIAVELERANGGKNVLGPLVHRTGPRGETTISERELRRGQRWQRAGESTEARRERVAAAAQDISAPELLPENAGLFILYVGGEHIPDMVLPRKRGGDGQVRSVAIEVELTEKAHHERERVLRWYRDHGELFAQVVYIMTDRGAAARLRAQATALGLGEDRLIIRRYMPDFTIGTANLDAKPAARVAGW